jgi:hypothetical protein
LKVDYQVALAITQLMVAHYVYLQVLGYLNDSFGILSAKIISKNHQISSK